MRRKLQTKPSIEQAAKAVAIALYDHPSLLKRVSNRLDIETLPPLAREVALLIEDYPHVAEEFKGELVQLADRVGLNNVVDDFLWLQLTPDDERAQLPSLKKALDILAPDKLAPCGALELWRTELSQGVNGQHRERVSSWKLDNLWCAAAHERQAMEFDAEGLRSSAHDSMQRAREQAALLASDETDSVMKAA